MLQPEKQPVNGHGPAPNSDGPSIRFEVGSDDIMSFERHRNIRSQSAHAWLGLCVLGSLLIGWFIFSLARMDGASIREALIPGLVLFLFISGLGVVMYFAGLLGPLPILRLIGTGAKSAYTGMFELRLEPDVIRIISLHGDCRWRYLDIDSVIESKRHTFITFESAVPIIMPHNGIAAGNRAAFIEALHTRLEAVDPGRESLQLSDRWPSTRWPFVLAGGEQLDHVYCRKCRYDMVGVQDGRCPDCGTMCHPRAAMTYHRYTPVENRMFVVESCCQVWGAMALCFLAMGGVAAWWWWDDIAPQHFIDIVGVAALPWAACLVGWLLFASHVLSLRRRNKPYEGMLGVYVIGHMLLAATWPVAMAVATIEADHWGAMELRLLVLAWLAAVAVPLLPVLAVAFLGKPYLEGDPPRVSDDTSDPPTNSDAAPETAIDEREAGDHTATPDNPPGARTTAAP